MPIRGDATVRYLWVLRHGKAASDAPWGGGDRDRPLAARGRRDAAALGARLAEETPVLGLEQVPRPELAVCSAAVRTRQTARLIVKAFPERLRLDSYRSLYGADVGLVLRRVRELDPAASSVLMVGHNPTMYELVRELLPDADDGPGSGRARLEAQGFPTCALATVALHVAAWEETAAGCGSLAGLFTPPY